MYISEDFQLEYFIHRDPMCDLSVPFIFLSSVCIYVYIYIKIFPQAITDFFLPRIQKYIWENVQYIWGEK